MGVTNEKTRYTQNQFISPFAYSTVAKTEDSVFFGIPRKNLTFTGRMPISNAPRSSWP